MDFNIKAPFEPAGDQPQAIEELVDGVNKGLHTQVLLGATGTGKTYTIAQVINRVRKPTLVIAHNKTLAAQLASELKAFFPDNADRKSTRLNSSHRSLSRMPSSA